MSLISFLIFFAILQSYSCTVVSIEVINSAAAVSFSVIKHVPGLEDPLPFYLETGYVGVGNSDEDQLFYYFIESENNPKEDPLVIWFTGGPGCSGLTSLGHEMGPFTFKYVEYNGGIPPLKINSYAFTKVSNMIFIDQPVGTGFSYTVGRNNEKVGDLSSVKQSVEFLKKWLISHPQFLPNPLYIGGTSYAGKIVPIVTFEIANGLDRGELPHMNLQGYIVGSAVASAESTLSSKIPFAHGMGLISDELYESTKKNCEGMNYEQPSNQKCKDDLEVINKLQLSNINKAQILEKYCPSLAVPKFVHLVEDGVSLEDDIGMLHLPPQPLPTFGCRSYEHLLGYFWANNEDVRNALKIRKGTKKEWFRCDRAMRYIKDVGSSVGYHKNVTSRGYRALVYSGDHDLVVPFVGTQDWIRSLNFSIVDEWRPWLVDNQVAGYTRTYSNNLTFVTVKGGGHTVVEYKPAECYAMYTRWMSGSPL